MKLKFSNYHYNKNYYEDYQRKVGDKIIYDNNYKYSKIRAYLNGKYEKDDICEKHDKRERGDFEGNGFLQTAFTAKAQNLITKTNIDGLNDKIFLLSYGEAINTDYGFDENNYNKDTKRIRKNTNFLTSSISEEKSDTYFLRDGKVTEEGDIEELKKWSACWQHGIVPALCISLK